MNGEKYLTLINDEDEALDVFCLVLLGSRAVVVCIVGWLRPELICEGKAKCQLNFGTVKQGDIEQIYTEEIKLFILKTTT